MKKPAPISFKTVSMADVPRPANWRPAHETTIFDGVLDALESADRSAAIEFDWPSDMNRGQVISKLTSLASKRGLRIHFRSGSDRFWVWIGEPIKTKWTGGPESLISKLPLHHRTVNCLTQANLETLADVIVQGAKNLRRIKNFGPRGIAEIQSLLRSAGLTLPDWDEFCMRNTKAETETRLFSFECDPATAQRAAKRKRA